MQLNDGPDDDQGAMTRFTILETSDSTVPLPPSRQVAAIEGAQAIDAGNPPLTGCSDPLGL